MRQVEFVFFSVKFTCSDWCHAVVAVGRIMFKFGYNSTCSEERHFWLFFLGGFSLVDGNASAKDLSHFYIYTSGTNIFMQLDGIAFIKQLNFCLPPATSFLFFLNSNTKQNSVEVKMSLSNAPSRVHNNIFCLLKIHSQ